MVKSRVFAQPLDMQFLDQGTRGYFACWPLLARTSGHKRNRSRGVESHLPTTHLYTVAIL